MGVGPYFMVRPERVELSTFSLGMKCSIHLSYGRTGGIIADFRLSPVPQKGDALAQSLRSNFRHQ